MDCDYVIKNGITIDYSTNSKIKKDIYVKGERIVEGDQNCNAEKIVDAEGKYVVPGLIDLHGHYFQGGNSLGVNADVVCPAQGVTTCVDAGSSGSMNFMIFYQSGILGSLTEVKAYINLAPEGVKAGYVKEESYEPEDLRYDEIVCLFRKYPEVIKGLKLRISKETTGELGTEPLKKAVEIAERIRAEGFRCTLAVHVANIPEEAPIEEILSLLKPGDSYTHFYQNLGETIFDDNRKVKESLRKARDRGVLFETGNGSIHWTIPNIRDACRDGFMPDIISSDVVRERIWEKPSFGLNHAMNLALNFGMDEVEILKATTYSPAKSLGMLDQIGTLQVGTRADIAILDIIPSKQLYFDRFENQEKGEKIFLPLMTIREGKVIFRQPFFFS